MMNATTEATKLNFMTDHGSTRDSVSIACRLLDRRTLTFGAEAEAEVEADADLVLVPDPPRKADVTELASPAAAPPSPAAAPPIPAAAPLSPAAAPAAVDEKPPVNPLRVPLPAGEES
jgi:hypothetical protein